jgi:hypothetical protein
LEEKKGVIWFNKFNKNKCYYHNIFFSLMSQVEIGQNVMMRNFGKDTRFLGTKVAPSKASEVDE